MKLTYGSIKGSDYRIIDVSIWMDSFEFPGNPEWNLQGPFNRVPGKNPEYVYDFNLCTQTGTHIQGPHYFTKNGKKISEFPMDSFEGWAHVFDVNKPGTDITSGELKEQLHDVDLNDKILIIRSGHMEELSSNECPLDLPSGLGKAVSQSITGNNRYPDALCKKLKAKVAKN